MRSNFFQPVNANGAELITVLASQYQLTNASVDQLKTLPLAQLIKQTKGSFTAETLLLKNLTDITTQAGSLTGDEKQFLLQAFVILSTRFPQRYALEHLDSYLHDGDGVQHPFLDLVELKRQIDLVWPLNSNKGLNIVSACLGAALRRQAVVENTPTVNFR